MPSLLATLGLDVSPFKRNALEAKSEALHLGRELKSALSEVAGEQLAKVASVAAIEQGIEKTLEYAETIRKLSIRTGESTDKIQEWAYAAMKADVDLNVLITAFEKFQILQAKAKAGNEEAGATLNRLGLDDAHIQNLHEAGRNFELIAGRIKDAEINGQMLKDVTLAFGKSAREVLPVFKNDLQAAAEEARNIGSIMDAKSIAEAAEASERLKMAWASLRPLVADVVGWASRRIMEMADFFKLTIGLLIVDFEARRDAGKRGDTFWERSKENWHGQFDKDHNVDRIAANARRDYIEKVMKEREEREKALQKMEATLSGEGGKPQIYSDEEAGNSKTEKKAAEETLRLRNEAARITSESALREMTAAERVEEITRRISRIKSEMEDAYDEKDEAQSQVNLAKAEAELARAKKETEKEEERAKSKQASAFRQSLNEVEANVKIGAYGGDPMLNIGHATQKSEQHLAKIHQTLKEHTKLLRGTRF